MKKYVSITIAALFIIISALSSNLSAQESLNTTETLAAAWNAKTVYIAGDRVTHNSIEWEAQWWSKGNIPGASHVWKYVKRVTFDQGEFTLSINIDTASGSYGPISAVKINDVKYDLPCIIKLDKGTYKIEVLQTWWGRWYWADLGVNQILNPRYVMIDKNTDLSIITN